MKHLRVLLSASMLLFATVVLAQSDTARVDSTTANAPSTEVAPQAPPPAPVTNLVAKDAPDDHGHAIVLSWTLSPDESRATDAVTAYLIYRGTSPNGPFDSVGAAAGGQNTYTHMGAKEKESKDYFPDYKDFYYRVDAVTAMGQHGPSAVVGPVQAKGQWYNSGRTPVLFAVLIFGALTVWFLRRARRGENLYVRPLGGIEAVDEAIGRATEMGKPILYVMGLGTAADIATIASFTILGRVAKRVAEYQTHLIVPCYDPIVMAVAQETVKGSFMDAGRPDDYKEDMVYFLTNSQFGYVGAVNGIMLRQLPATNVYMGKFYAESLLLAETGALAGSIQIAGTDEVAQIPFFVVACDYTLIGEELYAASAYLGREPLLLGSLKAQDYAKAAVIILALIGAVLLNIAVLANSPSLQAFKDLFKVAN